MRLTSARSSELGHQPTSVSVSALMLTILAVAVLRLAGISLAFPQGSGSFPDEVSYATLAEILARTGDWAGWNGGEGATLVPGSLSLLAPASVFVKVGVSPLVAVRLTSVLFSVVAQMTFLAILMSLAPDGEERNSRRLTLKSWRFVALTVMVLFPSAVFWTSLGLKDSIVISTSLLAVLACMRIREGLGRWSSIVWAFVLVVSLIVQLLSRAYVLIALVAAIGIYGVWCSTAAIRRYRFSIRSWRAAALVATSTLIVLAGVCISASTSRGDSSLAGSVFTSIGAQSPLQHLDALPGIRERAARLGASGFIIEICSGQPAPRSAACEVVRLPQALGTVVARPIWPLDDMSRWSPTWARLALLAQIDTILWCSLLGLAFALICFRRTLSRPLSALALTYLGLTWLGMALTEGNLGTLMRHRLILLWPLCLLVALAGTSRKESHREAVPTPRDPHEF